MNEIKQINKEQSEALIENKKPLGKFYLEDNGVFVGFDNSTGDCFVEEFKDKDTCLAWLNNDSLVYHSEIDFGKTIGELKNKNEMSNNECFEVIITEKLVTSVTISAKSKEEALSKVEDMYNHGKIMLKYDDLSEVNFEVDTLTNGYF